jgi:hypothetical protein
MFAKLRPTWDLIIGGATALAVSALGWLNIATAPTPDAADASIRGFGTLVTVVFGSVAALWWNQSARLPAAFSEEDTSAIQSQNSANILNSAAATFTVVSLFCSVFSGLPWKSTGSCISAVAVLTLLLFAGSEIRQAVSISLRLRPKLREIFVVGLIALAAAALLFHVAT